MTGTVVDEDMKLLSDHTINIDIVRNVTGDVEYYVNISEISQPEFTADSDLLQISVTDVSGYARITSDGEFIDGKAADLRSGEEYSSAELYEKYRDEALEQLEDMYELFGKEYLT